MTARFLQIHTLTSYPASLLNRDDAGFAKRMTFGGTVRTRISSQCLKRHWRVFDGENSLASLEAPQSVRSRVSFEKYLVEPLVSEGFAEDAARTATLKIIGIVFGSEAKKEKAEQKSKGRQKKSASDTAEPPAKATTPQVTVLGRPELDYLCALAREALRQVNGDESKVVAAIDASMKNEKELKRNIQALKPGSLEAGLGAALFGRMVTGDILSRTDAAIHVAHALTTHAQMNESDYFSAIDDLVKEEGEQESGHINASELTSGVYYGYAVVDVRGLHENLGGDVALAGEVVQRLVHTIATVTPGAKKGSTAPYAYSHLVLLESGKAQPRTLQNAFVEAVRGRGNVIEESYRAMATHLAELDGMYGKGEERAHAGLRTAELFENGMTLPQLATWAKARVES
jgi:CRISPR system Cascade subunit CasC